MLSPSVLIRSGQWFDIVWGRWLTLPAGKRSLDLSFTTLYQVSLIFVSGKFPLSHVNHTPEKPKSSKWQFSKTSRNAFILFSSLGVPPHFSKEYIISLKSPLTYHGWLLSCSRFVSKSHESLLLWTYGEP